MNSIPTSPASSVAVRKVAVICELKYERVSGVTPNYLTIICDIIIIIDEYSYLILLFAGYQSIKYCT